MRSYTWTPARTVALTALFVAGCSEGEEPAVSAMESGPAPAVVVVEARSESVAIMRDFVARTAAVETVEVRARVEAVLLSQEFEEGMPVKAGQLLYKLDERTYAANVAVAAARTEQAAANLKLAEEQVSVRAAEAGLVRTQAQLRKAQQDVARLEPLAAKDAVPRQDLDTALAAEEVAQAEVDAQEAELQNARIQEQVGLLLARAEVESTDASLVLANLDLEYCTIKSPIDGMVGRRQVDPGNLVGRGEQTVLTTISSVDPIYVTFAISEAEYLALDTRRRGRETPPQGGGGSDSPIQLLLADDSIYEFTGTVAFGERAVDESTGTLELIAEFPNPDGRLRPGQFGRCRLQVLQLDDAVLVPQRAIIEQQGVKFVMVVGEDSIVALRGLQVSERVGEDFVVLSGLEAGERVILEGQMKARPGSPVRPMPAAASAEPDQDEE